MGGVTSRFLDRTLWVSRSDSEPARGDGSDGDSSGEGGAREREREEVKERGARGRVVRGYHKSTRKRESIEVSKAS